MKTNRFLFLLLFISSAAFSQKEMTISEVPKSMSKGMQNGYVTEVPQAKLKEVASAWKKYIRHETKNTIEELNNEIIIRGTLIKNVSANPLNVYSKLLETEQGVMISAFFTEDDSIFISSALSDEKSIAARKFIRDFVVQQYRIAVGHELDNERKKLSRLEDELESLVKSIEKSNRRINDNDRKIDKCKDAIATNRKEQEARAGEIASQKETVRSFAGSKGEEKDLAEKKLKDLEKEKKKLEKKSDNLHDDIEDYEADSRQQKRNIEKNEDAQKSKKTEISLQKETTKVVEKKLDNIK
ncbi:MAG: hypothetical protein NT126_09080 [Bacteroidetes bacterium]|nr:hypothetical protein [Bacteroidota bacterium]